MELRFKLEEKRISNNCLIKTYITNDEKHYILELDYLDGKFIAEKLFSNDYKGIASMEDVKNRYQTEYEFQSYFGIV